MSTNRSSGCRWRRTVSASGTSLTAGPQSPPAHGDAAERDRARGVRGLEGTPAGRGVRPRPRRVRGASVHPDPRAGRWPLGQDLEDPEVGDESHRTEAARLVPREPRAPGARPSPADIARITLRVHDQGGREGESHERPGDGRPESPRREPEAHARPDGPRYASSRSARVQRPQRYPESRGERAPRQRCAGGDPVARRRERAIRQGIRPARIRPRGNVRRDLCAVQTNGMRTRPIPLVRARPPRFLGLHADAGSGGGRRAPHDPPGAAAFQGLGRANVQRTPL